MKNEHSFLIQKDEVPKKRDSGCNSRPPLFLKRIYEDSGVHSKEALIILIWSSVITTSFTILLLYPSLSAVSNWDMMLFISSFAFTPLCGYLGEKWTRYKVIITGTIILVSYAIHLILTTILVILDVHQETSEVIEYLCIITILSALVGFGLFLSNIIQFGTDQLQFASSQHLAAFVRLFVCIFIFSWGLSIVLLLATALEFKLIYYGTYCFIFILLFGFAIILVCCCKQQLVIEPPTHIDPIKMIWRVMKYAWKHKYPVRHSAFTYNENPPSRLDLANKWKMLRVSGIYYQFFYCSLETAS